ncbi:MAG: hypothetical protein F6K56_26565 [Moorea sp. SIO3G5]|nr:hypothetical protein [Moorena sp. SIO3G5]
MIIYNAGCGEGGECGKCGEGGEWGGVGSYWSSDRGVWEDGEDRREERWQ